MANWRKLLNRSLLIFLIFSASAIVFMLVFLPFGALLVPIMGDAMDWRSHYLAGVWSTDCGRVKVRGDATSATECAQKANAVGKPFRVRYNIQGIDSWIADGIVRTPDGKLFALSFDSCPMGCGFSLMRQRVSVKPCPEPVRLYVNSDGRIDCFRERVSSKGDIMAPNVEPY